jgi:hypothetical protein
VIHFEREYYRNGALAFGTFARTYEANGRATIENDVIVGQRTSSSGAE